VGDPLDPAIIYESARVTLPNIGDLGSGAACAPRRVGFPSSSRNGNAVAGAVEIRMVRNLLRAPREDRPRLRDPRRWTTDVSSC
jgi:hypothetical protein